MFRVLSLLLVLCCAHAFGQPVHLLHKEYAAKDKYVDSLRETFSGMPESQALAKIDELISWAEKNGDDELAAIFNIFALKRRADIVHNEEMQVKIAEFVLDVKDRGMPLLEADAFQFYAKYLSDGKKFGLAFENFLAAYNIYSGFTPEQCPKKREYIYGFGGAYYQYGDYDNCIRYMKQAYATSAATDMLEWPINNTLGMCYRMIKKYDSSEYYFRIIYNAAIKNNDSSWIGIAGGNIGINLFLQKRYDEAVPLIENDVRLSMATSNIRNAASSMHVLSQIYYLQKKYDISEQYIRRALAVVEAKSFWPDYQLGQLFYTQMFKVLLAKNDTRNAALYADSALTAKDSVAAQYNAISLAKAKEKVEFVQHQLEKEQIAGQEKIQMLIRNSLIIVILLLTVIAILFINRLRLRQKKLEAEKINAEQELDMAGLQLNGFRQSVQEKNNLIEQFTAELEKIKQTSVVPNDDEVLFQLEKSVILTDEQWEHFRALFEKVHRNFFINLKKKMPDLTQAEIRFLALTKLKLSPKEMASMLGISANAIRIYRHRLRKKLELDKEDMIEELVENI